MLPLAHPSPHSKRHLDRFSRFWATVCITVRHTLSNRCPVCPVCLSVTLVYCGQTVGRIKMKLCMQAPTSLCYMGSWDQLPRKVHSPPIFGPCLLWPNGRPTQLQVSSCCIAHGRESIYFTMCRSFPLKVAPSHGGSGPHLIHGSPESTSQTTSWSVQPFFAGLTIVTDRPTDRQHPTRSITISHLRSTAMRPKTYTTYDLPSDIKLPILSAKGSLKNVSSCQMKLPVSYESKWYKIVATKRELT